MCEKTKYTVHVNSTKKIKVTKNQFEMTSPIASILAWIVCYCHGTLKLLIFGCEVYQ